MVDNRARPEWRIPAPIGGWGPPWPQAVELVGVLPGDRWTLVGGLMIQLHAVHAGLPLTRATLDVDIVLHIETGATTFGQARYELERLGYELHIPSKGKPVHRFTRGDEQVDVMVADHLTPRLVPTVAGHNVFQVPAGTSALRKTVDCTIDVDADTAVTLSLPDVLGALILKGAACKADTRDAGRHLDDAALLASVLPSPDTEIDRLKGTDRGRIQFLAKQLRNPTHRSWLLVPQEVRQQGFEALQILARDSVQKLAPRRIGDPPLPTDSDQ